MLFRCDWCGELFNEPDTRRVTENLDGENGWWTHTEEYCPYCGSQDFEEYAEIDDEDEDEPEE